MSGPIIMAHPVDQVIDACIHVKDCHETNSGLDDYDEEDEEQKCDCEHEICYLKFVFNVVNFSVYNKKHQNCRALYSLLHACQPVGRILLEAIHKLSNRAYP